MKRIDQILGVVAVVNMAVAVVACIVITIYIIVQAV